MLRSIRTGSTTVANRRNFPRGIYVVNDRDVAHLDATFTHPYVDGIMRRSHWKTIEPTVGGDAQTGASPSGTKLGTFWGAVEQDITRARAVSKKIILSVFPGMLTPNWALTGVTTLWQTVCGGGLSGEEHHQPLPWDTTYQDRYIAFVQTMGSLYDGTDMFVPTVGPGSVSAEMGLQDTCNDPLGNPQLQQWIDAGYLPSKMYAAWYTFASAFIDAFPLGYTTAATTQPLPQINEAGEQQASAATATRDQILVNLKAKHGRRMSVQSFGLSAADDDGSPPGGWTGVQTYSPDGPAGFEYQTSCWNNPSAMGDASSPSNAFKLTCDWGRSAGAGAQYLIVYEPDVTASFTNGAMMDAFKYTHDKLWASNVRVGGQGA